VSSGDKILDFFLLNNWASVFPIIIFLKLINFVLYIANVARKLLTFLLFTKPSLPHNRIQEGCYGVRVIRIVSDYIVFFKLQPGIVDADYKKAIPAILFK
jgi:hypothetical protein